MKLSIHGRLARRAAALGLTCALAFSAIPFAGAVTQEQIDQMKQKKSDLTSQMNSVQSQINDLQDKQNSALDQSLLYQQQLERAAFEAGGRTYHAPAQLVGDFLAHRPSAALGSVHPTYRPGVTLCELHDVLPARITSVLEQALPALDKRLHGFAGPDAVMTAPETRSSSPVRIVRGENRQSEIAGLYPCGEGAGYAGGIMSAAVDGILTAEAILNA